MEIEDIKKLAKLERGMDAGQVQFVVYNGQRVGVHDEIMKKFGLLCGQTINGILFEEILKESISLCKQELILAEADLIKRV